MVVLNTYSIILVAALISVLVLVLVNNW